MLANFAPYIGIMDTDQTMRLLYLTLLGGAIAGSYVVSNRSQLGKMAQQAAIWGLIFFGVIGAIGLWDSVSQTVAPRQSILSNDQISVPRQFDGHYYLTLGVNGVEVEFLIDTGASQIVLSRQDADRVGLDPSELNYIGTAQTANGTVRTAPVTLDVLTLDAFEDINIRAVVNEGEMDKSLLGMSYLNVYSSIEIRNNQLLLTR